MNDRDSEIIVGMLKDKGFEFRFIGQVLVFN